MCRSPRVSTFRVTPRPVSANHLFSIPVPSDRPVKVGVRHRPTVNVARCDGLYGAGARRRPQTQLRHHCLLPSGFFHGCNMFVTAWFTCWTYVLYGRHLRSGARCSEFELSEIAGVLDNESSWSRCAKRSTRSLMVNYGCKPVQQWWKRRAFDLGQIDGACPGGMIEHPRIRSSLRAHSNQGNISEHVRRKSNRFLLEITAMIPRVGLQCRRILTLRSEGAGPTS
jgi:hypothetical protein